jgi:hypothetical protein
MSAQYKPQPPYMVPQQDIKVCTRCHQEITWQWSQQKRKNYPTDVKRDAGLPMTARNWFHNCQSNQQPNLFQKVLNMTGVQQLFDKAQVHLKYPKIRLQTPSGQPVTIYRAGQMSKYVGQLMVTDGKKFGMNQFFGRIDKAGAWFPRPGVTSELEQLLDALSNQPAATAAAYGKLTGNCCFCGLPLSDQRSTDVGYGPVCADHYGMPWG